MQLMKNIYSNIRLQNFISNNFSTIIWKKTIPFFSRYNGVAAQPPPPPNGTRLTIQRPPAKYSSPPAAAPVNLVKEELPEDLAYSHYRLYQPSPHYYPSPYQTIYQSPYTPILRPNFIPPPPLSPLEAYSPTGPTPSSTGSFLSAQPASYSSATVLKNSQTVINERRIQQPAPPPPQVTPSATATSSFKVPSGKEGSLKHRILLTRPEEAPPPRSPLNLQRSAVEASRSEGGRKRFNALTSPPESPKKPLNNNTVPSNFAKGSMVQLATGEIKKVEDLRTEDFVLSAEKCPNLRLADSTVVRIEENPITGTATITLSYNQRRTQVIFCFYLIKRLLFRTFNKRFYRYMFNCFLHWDTCIFGADGFFCQLLEKIVRERNVFHSFVVYFEVERSGLCLSQPFYFLEWKF